MSIYDDATLDCQDCGEVIRRLSMGEAQRVAHNPENFIVWCRPCGRAQARELEKQHRREALRELTQASQDVPGGYR